MRIIITLALALLLCSADTISRNVELKAEAKGHGTRIGGGLVLSCKHIICDGGVCVGGVEPGVRVEWDALPPLPPGCAVRCVGFDFERKQEREIALSEVPGALDEGSFVWMDLELADHLPWADGCDHEIARAGLSQHDVERAR